jgi:hypothetical protein
MEKSNTFPLRHGKRNVCEREKGLSRTRVYFLLSMAPDQDLDPFVSMADTLECGGRSVGHWPHTRTCRARMVGVGKSAVLGRLVIELVLVGGLVLLGFCRGRNS